MPTGENPSSLNTQINQLKAELGQKWEKLSEEGKKKFEESIKSLEQEIENLPIYKKLLKLTLIQIQEELKKQRQNLHETINPEVIERPKKANEILSNWSKNGFPDELCPDINILFGDENAFKKLAVATINYIKGKLQEDPSTKLSDDFPDLLVAENEFIGKLINPLDGLPFQEGEYSPEENPGYLKFVRHCVQVIRNNWIKETLQIWKQNTGETSLEDIGKYQITPEEEARFPELKTLLIQRVLKYVRTIYPQSQLSEKVALAYFLGLDRNGDGGLMRLYEEGSYNAGEGETDVKRYIKYQTMLLIGGKNPFKENGILSEISVIRSEISEDLKKELLPDKNTTLTTILNGLQTFCGEGFHNEHAKKISGIIDLQKLIACMGISTDGVRKIDLTLLKNTEYTKETFQEFLRDALKKCHRAIEFSNYTQDRFNLPKLDEAKLQGDLLDISTLESLLGQLVDIHTGHLGEL